MADISTYQLQVQDTSPTVSYWPYPDSFAIPPDVQNGWSPLFTGNSTITTLNGLGIGSSSHVTSRDGATLSIQWFGNAIQLFGNTTQATYDILLDGKNESSSNSSTGILATFEDLATGNHTITLTTHINSTSASVAFDSAVITVSTGLVNATISSSLIADAISYTGQWSDALDLVAPNQTLPFRVSQTAGDQALLVFSGSAITVAGFRDFQSGHYNVTLDGSTFSYDSQSSFTEPTMLFFATGLNSSTFHQLTITNADNFTLAIGAVNVTTVSGGCSSCVSAETSSGGYPRGTIIGLATASGIAFLILLSLIICIVWRRRRSLVHDQRCHIMNLKCPSSRRRPNPSADFVDIRRGSDDGHLAFKAPQTPPPIGVIPRRRSRPSFSLARNAPPLIAQFPRPPREYAPSSDRENMAARYSQVIDISRRSPLPQQYQHSARESLGALLGYDPQTGGGNAHDRHTLDLPVSVSISRRSRELMTPSRVDESGEIPFSMGPRRTTRHAYAQTVDSSRESRIGSPLSEERGEEYLSVADVSPFRVSFPAASTDGHGRSRSRPPSQQLSQLQAPGVPQLTLEQPTPTSNSIARDQIYSFLDFSSSSSGSRSRRHLSASEQSAANSSLYATDHNPSNRESFTSQRPYRMSLSLSVDNQNPTLVTQPMPPSPSQRQSRRYSDLNSPTESIPVSVSDIQFRHPDDGDSDPDVSMSRRTSGSHLPPHPPLPQSPTTPKNMFATPPLIAQKLLGRPPGAQTSLTQPRPQGPRPVSLSPRSTSYTPGMPRPR